MRAATPRGWTAVQATTVVRRKRVQATTVVRRKRVQAARVQAAEWQAAGEPSAMIKLESFYHLHEAQMLVDQLHREQIPAFVNSERRGAAGALPFTQAYCEVWLDRDQDEERGRELLRRLSKSRTESTADVSCPSCGEDNPGNFGLCWSCGKQLGAIDEAATQATAPVRARKTTQHVLTRQRPTGVRVAWAAAGLIPGALFFIRGFELTAVLAAAGMTFVLWLLSGSKSPDYCAECHVPLTFDPAQCPECGRSLDGKADEKELMAAGRKVRGNSMRSALAILLSLVLVTFTSIVALVFGDDGRPGGKQLRPASARPY